MIERLSLVVVVMICVSMASAALAATTTAPAPPTSPNGSEISPAEMIKRLLEAEASNPAATRPSTGVETVTAVPLDPAVQTALRESWLAYYRSRTMAYDHRARSFEWQLWSSRVIFWTVIALVLASIYFAAVQFHATLAALRQSTTPPASAGTVTASAKDGISVTSPVLGVIILAMAFAFFYLYLVYVYQITEVR